MKGRETDDRDPIDVRDDRERDGERGDDVARVRGRRAWRREYIVRAGLGRC